MESKATRPLVGNPKYRQQNLAYNGIHFRKMGETLPEHVHGLANDMFKGRQSPEPEIKDIIKDANLTDLYINTGEA
ncbi:hypothetical protein PV04_10335 [Phialophora macrospora]|uniref:Uncharacterized protein n=1 Tax=Phialophora macrospora TaxID=1851006 RepID=A0A0D2FTY6_9EURO|nr:hypothetical protein PV04_10335 [Phialophora macrospora]